MSKPDKKTARAQLKQARKNLAALPSTKDETPEYRRRNSAVLEAEKNVPWYRR
jgi:hypothetical protein